MQRMGSGETLLLDRPTPPVQTCNVAGQQPHAGLYALHMRNTASGTWATLVREGRERVRPRLSQQALAELVGVDRTTIWRWESAGVRPENPEMVIAVAAALGVDQDEAMLAAGLAVAGKDAGDADPRLRGLDPNDPVVRKIMSFDVDDEMRDMMLDRHRHNLELDRQRYLAQLEQDERLLRRRGVA